MLIRPAHHSDAHDIAEVNVLVWQVAYQGLISQESLDSLSVPDITAKWKKSI